MERLTWDEIRRQYPARYVGLIDVAYADEDEMEIESAIVKYVAKDTSENQLFSRAHRGEVIMRYTTLEQCELMGALTL